MANAAGFIQESIWRDPDWRQLSRRAQALYIQLLSQKELDCAGILPLQPNKWAKGCAEMTVEQVWEDLEELQCNRFVLYDADTDEAFIRTYMRNSNIAKSPNMLRSASRSAVLVGSDSIRPVLAEELRAMNSADCLKAANEINPLPKGSGKGSETLPERVPEPFAKGSGVGVGVGVSHLGSNSRGEIRPQCSKHPNGNHEEPCHGCGRVREWDKANTAAVQADELEAKRRAREVAEQCAYCHGTNVIEVGDNEVRKCDHQAVAHG